MQKIQEFFEIFAMAGRTKLNAAHAQLRKLRIDHSLTISTLLEKGVFLNSHSVEVHKIC